MGLTLVLLYLGHARLPRQILEKEMPLLLDAQQQNRTGRVALPLHVALLPHSWRTEPGNPSRLPCSTSFGCWPISGLHDNGFCPQPQVQRSTGGAMLLFPASLLRP